MGSRSSPVTLLSVFAILICGGGPAYPAAFITINEVGFGENPPIVQSNLTDLQVTTHLEFANVTGQIDSPGPFVPSDAPGLVVLTEPSFDPFGPRISDVILLSVLFAGNPQTPSQHVVLSFFSDGFPDFEAVVANVLENPNTQRVEETGELQDITTLLGFDAGQSASASQLRRSELVPAR